MLTHAPWQETPDLRHGFLDGAESAGRDWPPIVARVGSPLPIVVPRQVHGTRVVTVAANDPSPEADGLVVGERGLLVGVVTADCVPVLLVAREARVAAAVHAGWRGAAAGVLEAAIERFVRDRAVAPGRIEAVIGPAIGGCCYEVGPEVRTAFTSRTQRTTNPAWTERGGRQHVDLRVAARTLLEAAGVGRVATVGPCTACGAGYHSYRRDGAGVGRQLSFVGWA